MSLNGESKQIEKAHCNRCQGDTNHYVQSNFVKKGEDQGGLIWWSDDFEILQCCGCDDVTFRRTEYFSEWEDWETGPNGEDIPVLRPRITYFPPAKWRREPRWIDQLSNEDELLGKLLSEVYSAIHSDSVFLACTGSRALIDRIITLKVGNSGTFPERLKMLKEKDLITGTDVDVIETALEAGHASAHRGWSAKRNELETVMNIIENLIERIFIVPTGAKDLRPKIPPRAAKG